MTFAKEGGSFTRSFDSKNGVSIVFEYLPFATEHCRCSILKYSVGEVGELKSGETLGLGIP